MEELEHFLVVWGSGVAGDVLFNLFHDAVGICSSSGLFRREHYSLDYISCALGDAFISVSGA